jgi:hypothetical protein
MEKVLNQQVTDFKNRLQQHPAFNNIQSLDELRKFTVYHIFLVWDYMSLLKSLQTQLTCTQTPWKPVQSPYIRYLVNSLVLKEESDLGADGEYASHYEMYRNAMQAMKADTGLMDNLMAHIETDMPVIKAIELSNIPGPVKDFLEYTFWVVQKTSLHEQAAVLCYGREGFGHQLIYQRAVALQQNHAEELNPFLYYLRHKNEINEKYHSQLSAILLEQLCGTDEKKWHEATQAANQSLRNRIRLFDYIHEKIVATKN